MFSNNVADQSLQLTGTRSSVEIVRTDDAAEIGSSLSIFTIFEEKGVVLGGISPQRDRPQFNDLVTERGLMIDDARVTREGGLDLRETCVIWNPHSIE